MKNAENNEVMERVRGNLNRRAIGLALAVLIMASLGGCGESGPKPLIVSGKVTIDGKPATEGGVTYHDAATGLQQFAGGIAPDGTYSIRSKKEEGLPPGLYHVTVLVTETPKSTTGDSVALPKSVSNQKFFNPKATPFKIEVKADAAPGAYDLAVTR